jgi:hypothetical protein
MLKLLVYAIKSLPLHFLNVEQSFPYDDYPQFDADLLGIGVVLLSDWQNSPSKMLASRSNNISDKRFISFR